ncbi:K(+)-transporting ATPase subunit F [Comamonas thiooxydans]|nr:K(+)-transporting ATPase subunit F [Comamonas thiooxydans]
MTITWIEALAALAALTALGLFAYLGYALLRPEKF